MVWVITTTLLLIDRVTKWMALIFLKDYAPIEIFPSVFRLNFAANRGVAFGLFSSFGYIQVYLAIILAIVFVYLLWKYDFLKIEKVAISMVLAGSLGNAMDRIFYGFVVDMLEITFFTFPVFNVADICIVLGIFILMIQLIFSKRPLAKRERKE